jgi:predicted DNA-binding transcriptional regulator AlpA
MNLTGKLSVKHFLHKSQGKKGPDKIKRYPLYIRITLDKKQADLRSNYIDIINKTTYRPIPQNRMEHALYVEMDVMNNVISNEKYLTRKEFIVMAGITNSRFWNLVNSKKINTKKTGPKSVVIPKSELSKVKGNNVPSGYFTKPELELILKSNEGEELILKKALEQEANTIYQIADLLKKNDFNIINHFPKQIIDHLCHPVQYAVQSILKRYLSFIILRFHSEPDIINWAQDFNSIYNGLKSFSNQELSKFMEEKFGNVLSIVSDISDQTNELQNYILNEFKGSAFKAAGVGTHAYEWAYFNLYTSFEEYLMEKGTFHKDKIEIIKAGLNNYYSHLGAINNKIFPYSIDQNMEFIHRDLH